MSNLSIQIIDDQISKLELLIDANTMAVGELFLKIQSKKVSKDFDADNFIKRIKEMEKMLPLLEQHEKYKTELEILQQTRAEIKKARSGFIEK